MKKVLITGASGFIGSFLVEEALSRGLDVYAGIRETSSLKYLQDPRIKFFKTDLSNKNTIKKDLGASDEFDYIILNAGLTKTCGPSQFDKVNYQYTKNILDALHEINYIPQKIILVSSLAVYGPGNPKTLAPIKNSDMPKPISGYGKSKLKIEKHLMSMPNMPYLIFRPTGVYGPRDRDFYVMYKTMKIGLETYVGTKKQLLTFIYVKDLARLFFDALTSNISRKSYFVTDLQHYTVVDFNESIKKALNKKKTKTIVFPFWFVKLIAGLGGKLACFFGRKAPTLNMDKYREISQNNWLCDSSDLVKDFGFYPKYNIDTGLQETIEWFKKENLL